MVGIVGAIGMAQSLIEQLQFGAVDGSAPITDLLRKAKLAAVKLGADEFAAWIDLEMNGYTDQRHSRRIGAFQGKWGTSTPYKAGNPCAALMGWGGMFFSPRANCFISLKRKRGFSRCRSRSPCEGQ
jgi:hypothetical protein